MRSYRTAPRFFAVSPSDPAGTASPPTPDLSAVVRSAVREALTASGFAPRPRGLLTPDEVATWLGVSRRTVEALTASGEIPVVRIGTGRRKLPRYAPESVEAFIRRSAGGTSARRA